MTHYSPQRYQKRTFNSQRLWQILTNKIIQTNIKCQIPTTTYKFQIDGSR